MPITGISFRPSSMPGFMQCPSYILVPDREYELIESKADMEFADLGSALHEIFADLIIKNIGLNTENLTPYCEKWGLTLKGYMGVARKAYLMQDKWAANMAQFFTDPVSERTIGYVMPDGTQNEGTPDLFQVNGDYIILLDLKSGMSDLDYTAQIKDYALILYRLFESQGVNTVFGYVWNPVIESYVGKEFQGPELDQYEEELLSRLEKPGKVYRKGPFCSYCKTLEICPHHRRAFLQMEDQVKRITIENIAEARPIIKAMEKIIKLYDDTEKAILKKYRRIDLGDGHELVYRQERRPGYDAPKVVQILNDSFGVTPSTIGPYLQITKASIDEVAKKIAPPRGIGKTQKAIFEALEDGEAIKEKYIEKRTIRRISTQTKEIENGGK